MKFLHILVHLFTKTKVSEKKWDVMFEENTVGGGGYCFI